MKSIIKPKALSVGIAVIFTFSLPISIVYGASIFTHPIEVENTTQDLRAAAVSHIEAMDARPVNDLDKLPWITDASSLTLQSPIYLPIIKKPCLPLFSDDFSNPGSGWPVADDGNIRYEYLAGEYSIMIRTIDIWAGATPGLKASDYILEVDVRNVSGEDGSYGLLFGYSDDGSQFYSFDLFPDGSYTIWKYENPFWTDLETGSSADINTGTATNRIKLKRNGSEISAYANGRLLTSFIDSTFLGERFVGLAVYSYDIQNSLDVRFDNFTVYPATCDVTNRASADSNDGSK